MKALHGSLLIGFRLVIEGQQPHGTKANFTNFFFPKISGGEEHSGSEMTRSMAYFYYIEEMMSLQSLCFVMRNGNRPIGRIQPWGL